MKLATCALGAVLMTGAAFAQDQAPAPQPSSGIDPVLAAGPPAPPAYTPPSPGMPVEDKEPSAAGQTPAFPEQTRAPWAPSRTAVQVETITEGLEYPWGMAIMPDGRLLVTERNGRMRIVTGHDVSPPVEGLPPVHRQEISGLADVALDPAFAENGRVYWSYVEMRTNGGVLAVARGRLKDGPVPRMEDVKVIYRQQPDLKSEHGNFGGRLLFDDTGALFVTLGDLAAEAIRPHIQSMDSSVGKIVRITTDGAAAEGNPFAREPGTRPELWAVGFRNPLGIAFRPGTQELWTSEVGPRGGDELNIIKRGGNYGWPVISYGQEYSGDRIGEGTRKDGYEQPVYYWDPVISPSSIAFYSGDLFPEWQGNLFVTSLSQRHLIRLVLDGQKVVGEERLLADRNQRLRLVKQAPDGSLYVLTDERKGALLRLTPASG